MYPAQGLNFKIGRGGLYLADWNGNTPPADSFIGDEVGNCENIVAGPVDPQNIQVYSSTQNNSPLAFDVNLRAGWQVTATCHEHTMENLLRFFAGTLNSASQSSGTSATVDLDDVVVGKTYSLGATDVSNVTIMRGTDLLVAGTDYVLYARLGFVKILAGGQVANGDDLDVTMDKAGTDYDDIRIGQSLSRICKVTFVADDSNTDGVAAKDMVTIWKAAVVLQGEYPLVSGDEVVSFPLQFNVLSDEQNHASSPLGYIRRSALSA